jgi:hypothetical protein
VATYALDFQVEGAWVALVEKLEEAPGRPVVINTRAANGEAIALHNWILQNHLDGLGRKLVVFWLIDQFIDSLSLLRDFMAAWPKARIHVVRSGAGQPRDKNFGDYDRSNLRLEIEASGGHSLHFDYFATRLRNQFYTHRRTIDWMCAFQKGGLQLGDRAEALRWRQANRAMFDRVFK